jgi:hypothetical protein
MMSFVPFVSPDLYLSLVLAPAAMFGARFGAQIEGAVSRVVEWMVDNRIYQTPISWRDWNSRYTLYDENWSIIGNRPQIITVKLTPQQYRLWPEYASSPPRPDAYHALATFVQLVIDRYHPVAVEIYNEPDCRIGEGAPEFFGAWVGAGETWFAGGERYGSAVNYVADHTSGALIIAGALMMHADSIKFLAGMVAGGLRADAVSYHCYIRSMADADRISRLAEEIRLATGLPLIVTETSLLGDGSPEHEAEKAQYMTWLRDRFGYLGVEAVNWYTLAGNGWEASDLAPTAWEVWHD